MSYKENPRFHDIQYDKKKTGRIQECYFKKSNYFLEEVFKQFRTKGKKNNNKDYLVVGSMAWLSRKK